MLHQVFGITESDHSVVFRTGVVHSDLSGKTWKPLTAQSLRLRTASDSSTASGPVCLEKDQPSSKRRSHYDRFDHHKRSAFSYLVGHLSSSPANTTSLEFQASSTGSAPSAPRAPDPRASGRSSSTTEFVHAGSSNARFKNTNYKELGSKVARESAMAVFGVAAKCTIGRVPVVGPILASEVTRVAREEVSKLERNQVSAHLGEMQCFKLSLSLSLICSVVHDSISCLTRTYYMLACSTTNLFSILAWLQLSVQFLDLGCYHY